MSLLISKFKNFIVSFSFDKANGWVITVQKTDMGKQATNDFEKNFIKLMSTACFENYEKLAKSQTNSIR